MYILCETFRCLPEAGALFDQDSYLIYGLTGAVRAFREKEAQQGGTIGSQIDQMMSRAKR